jgi:hypothetical protein
MDNELFPTPPQKKCLNCGTVLSGSYCSYCGQKDEHLHEPFWKLAGHFVADFFHFDSKFFRTIVPLLIRPGFLTKEYIAGRRTRYMKPVQLYIFMSVVFFLLFFIAATPSVENLTGLAKGNAIPVRDLMDSVSKNESEPISMVIDSIKQALKEDSDFENSLISIDSIGKPEKNQLHFNIGQSEGLPKTVEEYNDSISKLSSDKRPNFFTQYITRKSIEANAMDTNEFLKTWMENFFHNLPKLMFLLLPIFALIMKLLYIRRKIFLVDHAIFALHYHSFLFLLFTIVLVLNLCVAIPSLISITIFIFLIYLVVAIHNFYKQSWMRSIMKTMALLFIYFFFGAFALAISAGISALQM